MRPVAIIADPDSLHLEELVAGDGAITVVVRARRETAACPACSQPSARIHPNPPVMPEV